MSRASKILIGIAVAGVLLSCSFTAWRIYKLQFWRGPDVMFGDQNLKSTVALIELHKVRYGRYPEKLSDLKFLGNWDPIYVNSCSYYVNADRTRYCVRVERGWIAKPKLTMPAEFWQGTGYDPSLCR